MSDGENLTKQIRIQLQSDDKGLIGRECPTCEGYFKVKPGTGIKDSIPCTCPYCGHVGEHKTFYTKEQIAYARSYALREAGEMAKGFIRNFAQDFNRKNDKRDSFISFRMSVQENELPLANYEEKQLETTLICGQCTLQYAVYGVFAFCPDCGRQNSIQILMKSLEVSEKLLLIAQEQDKETAGTLIASSLNGIVATFDGFSKRLCRDYAEYSSDKARASTVSFQNVLKSRKQVSKFFGIDFAAFLSEVEWQNLNRAFQKRHLFAHNMGIIDEQYKQIADDQSASVGRKVVLDIREVRQTAELVKQIGLYLEQKFVQLSEERQQ